MRRHRGSNQPRPAVQKSQNRKRIEVSPLSGTPRPLRTNAPCTPSVNSGVPRRDVRSVPRTGPLAPDALRRQGRLGREPTTIASHSTGCICDPRLRRCGPNVVPRMAFRWEPCGPRAMRRRKETYFGLSDAPSAVQCPSRLRPRDGASPDVPKLMKLRQFRCGSKDCSRSVGHLWQWGGCSVRHKTGQWRAKTRFFSTPSVDSTLAESHR